MSPSIDKGQAGSKTVRTNRTACWQIKCRGEPPPTFTWVHANGTEIQHGTENFSILYEEYQGGATTTLICHRARMIDGGTYSLQGCEDLVHRGTSA